MRRSWFSLVAADGSTLLAVEKSGEFWDSDLIGLRALQESGRLFRYDAPRQHDNLHDKDRVKAMVPFLKGVMLPTGAVEEPAAVAGSDGRMEGEQGGGEEIML